MWFFFDFSSAWFPYSQWYQWLFSLLYVDAQLTKYLLVKVKEKKTKKLNKEAPFLLAETHWIY